MIKKHILTVLAIFLFLTGTGHAQSGATDSSSCADHLNTSQTVPTLDALLGCIAEMDREIKRIEQEANSTLSLPGKYIVPVGAVVAFNLDECPIEWTVYERAYGKFIRGVDLNGDVDPDGVRAIGQEQGGSIESHEHTITVVENGNPNGNGDRDGNVNYLISPGRNGRKGNLKTNTIQGTETRPVNVSLLYCIKN